MFRKECKCMVSARNKVNVNVNCMFKSRKCKENVLLGSSKSKCKVYVSRYVNGDVNSFNAYLDTNVKCLVCFELI